MENQTRNILIAAGAGVVVGAAAGILFAPAEGKKTRAMLKGKAEDLADKVSNTDPSHLIANLKDKVQSKMSNGKSEVKDELLDQIEQLEEIVEKA